MKIINDVKFLLIKLITNSLLVIILLSISSLSSANIDNPTPLIVLHGSAESQPSHLNKELQPLEDYKFLSSIAQINHKKNKSILKLKEFISQLAQITKNYRNNYEIVAYSVGGIILFEYLKSITIENSSKELLNAHHHVPQHARTNHEKSVRTQNKNKR